jgi:nitrogen regulatory protein P-II 1
VNLVTAVIKPFKLTEVEDALTAAGMVGVTITEVQGHGRQRGHSEVYRGAEYKVEFLPKVKVEVVCDDVDTPRVIDAITGAAQTGQIGDGKIWVVPVSDLVRIRTKELGTDAL